MKEKTTIKQKHMKKILMMFALLLGVSAAWAQQSSGDYYEGLTRKIGFSQMTRLSMSFFLLRSSMWISVLQT